MGRAGRDRLSDVRRVVAEHLPGCRIDSVARIGEGLENVAYQVNNELIVRFSRESDPSRRSAGVQKEARLLAAVAAVSPVPVPLPRFIDADEGCLAYLKIPGVPLLDVPGSRRAEHAMSIAAALGELLAALHSIPAEEVDDLVDVDDQPQAEWLRDAAESYASVGGALSVAHRERVEAFLGAPPSLGEYALVFSHNDLGIEHVLIDPLTWAVTGVIDWTDAAMVDPAYDFGLLFRDLGPAALDLALRRYRSDANDVDALRERAAFYARCSALEDLAYGIETGKDGYVKKGRAAMDWLFPPKQSL